MDLNASQAALLRAGYSARTAPPQGSRLLKNVDVQAAIATQQSQQLQAVEVRIEDVLRDLKALELLIKHLGLAASDQHQHVHFTPEQLSRMTDQQLDRVEAAYTVIAALEQEVMAAEAQRVSFSARAGDSISSDAAHPR